MRRILSTLLLLAGFAMSGLQAQDTVVVSGALTGGPTITWTPDNVYRLNGHTWLNAGDTLVIQAGTVVLADTGSNQNASSLIINRDAYIDAQGTPTNPIIFSSVLDNVNDPDDLLDKQTIGLWGGLIICGNAETNTANNGNEQVEGIPTSVPAGSLPIMVML